jgi:hypothetical protein
MFALRLEKSSAQEARACFGKEKGDGGDYVCCGFWGIYMLMLQSLS